VNKKKAETDVLIEKVNKESEIANKESDLANIEEEKTNVAADAAARMEATANEAL